MAKQILFGYQVIEGGEALVDSGDPHLGTFVEAMAAAKLVAKRLFPAPIAWNDTENGFSYGSCLPRGQQARYVQIALKTAEHVI